jgi:hypothetical protein
MPDHFKFQTKEEYNYHKQTVANITKDMNNQAIRDFAYAADGPVQGNPPQTGLQHQPFRCFIDYFASSLNGEPTSSLIIGYERDKNQGYRDVIHYKDQVIIFWEPEELELPLSTIESSGYDSSELWSSSYDEYSSSVHGPDGWFVYYKIWEGASGPQVELRYSPNYPLPSKEANTDNAIFWVLGKIIKIENEVAANTSETTWEWVQYWTGGQIFIYGAGASLDRDLYQFEGRVELDLPSSGNRETTYRVMLEGGLVNYGGFYKKYCPRCVFKGAKHDDMFYLKLDPDRNTGWNNTFYRTHVFQDSGTASDYYDDLRTTYPVQYPIHEYCPECSVTDNQSSENDECMRIFTIPRQALEANVFGGFAYPADNHIPIGAVNKNNDKFWNQYHLGSVYRSAKWGANHGFEGRAFVERAYCSSGVGGISASSGAEDYRYLVHIKEGYITAGGFIKVNEYKNYTVKSKNGNLYAPVVQKSKIAKEGDFYYVEIINNRTYSAGTGNTITYSQIKKGTSVPTPVKGKTIVPIGAIPTKDGQKFGEDWIQYQIGNINGNFRY